MLVLNKIIIHIIVVLLLSKNLHAQECNVSNEMELICKNIALKAKEYLPLESTSLRLENISFINCSIHTIHKNAFLAFHTVTKIDLSQVQLKFLQEGSFDGLDNLEKLHLNNNNIRKIQFGIFNSLENLKKLNIHFNEINEIEEQSFENMVKLETLRLGWNKLKVIPRNVFKDLPNLKHLFFNHNFITRLSAGTLTNLPLLLQLNVECNLLTTLEYGAITNIKNLQYLQIQHNKLTVIHESIFYGLTKITDLHVNNNTLTKLDIGKLLSYAPNLQTIELNHNAWTCDSLVNMISELKRRNVAISDNNTELSSNVMGISCETENDNLEEPYLRFINKIEEYFNRSCLDSTFYNFYQNFKIPNNLSEHSFHDYLKTTLLKVSGAAFNRTFVKYFENDISNSTFYNQFENDFLELFGNFDYFEEDSRNSSLYHSFNSHIMQKEFLRYFKDKFENSKFANYFPDNFTKSDFFIYFNKTFQDDIKQSLLEIQNYLDTVHKDSTFKDKLNANVKGSDTAPLKVRINEDIIVKIQDTLEKLRLFELIFMSAVVSILLIIVLLMLYGNIRKHKATNNKICYKDEYSL